MRYAMLLVLLIVEGNAAVAANAAAEEGEGDLATSNRCLAKTIHITQAMHCICFVQVSAHTFLQAVEMSHACW
jgi:hypothetical protein